VALTTYDRVSEEIKGTQANAGALTEQNLLRYIRTVTRRVLSYGYQFEPLYIAKKITPTGKNVNTYLGTLSLNDYLLEPVSITVGGTAVTYGTDVVSEPDDGQSPIRVLSIVDPPTSVIRSWFSCNGCGFRNSIVITGFWGMRTLYDSQGFFDSGIDTPVMTATQTSIVVSSVAGPDIYNRTPMFSAGNLIRIENEMCEITAVDSTTKTLSLIRGVRAQMPTAVAHAAGTAIQIWEPEEDVMNMVTRQAALLYARKGSYQQITTYPDGVNVTYPSDLLAEVRAIIQEYNYA
jgi:hypothetical protein